MTNLLSTIAPKSDQLNADDLIGGPKTIRVTSVKLCGEPDQPVAVHYDGDGGKPYKPCKSMRRVMVHVWGGDGAKFAGRSMTLYRDDKVQFGGMAVGGIRISHMSHIDRDVTMALTATRANRKPYTVKPLPTGKVETPETVDLLPILTEGREAAARGSGALTAWWGRLSREEKAAAKPTLDSELKAAAAKADETTFDDAPATDPASSEEPSAGDAAPQPPAGGDLFPGDAPPSSEEAPAVDGQDTSAAGAHDKLLDWARDMDDRVDGMTEAELAKLENSARFSQLVQAAPSIAAALNARIGKRKAALR